MVSTYARPSPVFVQGEGSYIYDVENRRYRDFTAGIAVNALGHCDPEFARIVADQVCLAEVMCSTTQIADGASPHTGENTRTLLELILQHLDWRTLETAS